MKIFDTNDAMAVLWELVSPISEKIPVYREIMDEDKNSVPQSYLLIREGITDSPRIYGDGQAMRRMNNATLILISNSTGSRSNDIHNKNRAIVKELLDKEGVSYKGYNLGYNESLKQSEYSWSVSFIYGTQ